jgi:hypothetical protein
MDSNTIICWWSGGITSAVACHLAIELFGLDNCRIIMIDTKNEDDDTYRFKADCEKWYGKSMEVISAIGSKYSCIQDVWRKYKSLNVAHGAICSSQLKRAVREEWQKTNKYKHQVFGFEFGAKEFNRALGLYLNHSNAKPIFPLLMLAYDKIKCANIIKLNSIEIPRVYSLGYKNNNCFKTGCVQGGIGYWQKIQREDVFKFNEMADIEHELTDAKGKPVTMLKDQSEEAKKSKNQLVFLRKNPKYPHIKCLADMPPCKVEPLFECNGLCGINDLDRNPTENQINYELQLELF